jgi:hypothetical protein
VQPRPKLIVLARDPVERYESARRMYLCFSAAAQKRAEQFHEEGKMDAYLKERTGRRMPVRRGMYMVGGGDG